MPKRKVILYISQSLDGFIASKDDDLDWLSIVEEEGEDYGYKEHSATIDTYLVGRKTYEVIVNLIGHFPQAKMYDCYIITRKNRPNKDGVIFYNGDIKELIHQLRQEEGKHIYCDGGGEIVKLLMDNDLIDEYIISIIPTVLGSGKRLFIGDTIAQQLKHISTTTYKKGLVQLRYERDRTV